MARTTCQEAGSIACKLRLLSREISASANRLLEPLDLTPGQSEFLYHLTHGESSPSVIARRMGIDASNLSRMIRQFEERGLIKRKTDPDNRRRVSLVATAAGRSIAKASDPHAELIQNAITQALTDPQRRTLMKSICKISEALAQLGPDDMPKPTSRKR